MLLLPRTPSCQGRSAAASHLHPSLPVHGPSAHAPFPCTNRGGSTSPHDAEPFLSRVSCTEGEERVRMLRHVDGDGACRNYPMNEIVLTRRLRHPDPSHHHPSGTVTVIRKRCCREDPSMTYVHIFEVSPRLSPKEGVRSKMVRSPPRASWLSTWNLCKHHQGPPRFYKSIDHRRGGVLSLPFWKCWALLLAHPGRNGSTTWHDARSGFSDTRRIELGWPRRCAQFSCHRPWPPAPPTARRLRSSVTKCRRKRPPLRPRLASDHMDHQW